MTALAALSLNDGQATPVATVFSPVAIDSSGVAKWLAPAASFDARRSATLSVGLPKNGSSVIRVKTRFLIPVMDAVDTTKRIGDSYANLEVVISKLASTQDRKDLQAYVKNALANAAFTAAIVDFEGQY
jgi:hypothetical protein